MPHGISERSAALLETALPSSVSRIQTDAFDTSRPEHIMYLGTQRRPRWLRYVGAAMYYRCDPPPVDVAWVTNPDGSKRLHPAFLHFPNDANGDGGENVAPGAATPSNPRGGSWFRLEPVMGENDLYQYGGILGEWNDYNTGAVANWRAINDYKNFRASEFYHPNTILFIPSGGFAVDKPVIVKEGTIHLTGKREARDGAKSCLFFRDTDESFIIHYDNTSGDRTPAQQWVPPSGDRRSGSFTILRGFGIFNQAAITKDYRAVADMILARGRAHIESMWLSGAPRHAINFVTSIGPTMDNPQGAGNEFAAGNANSSRAVYNSIQWCGASGIRCIGADSNAILIFANEENFCGQSGTLEESFLGPNAVIANHTTDNGLGVGSTYAHGYKHELGVDKQTKSGCYAWVAGADGVRETYVARAPGNSQLNGQRWGELVATRPGTNEAIWSFVGRDPGPGGDNQSWPSWFAKKWLPDQPRGAYVWAASRLFQGPTNYSGSILCYDEGGQPPAQYLNAHGIHRGNIHAAGVLTGSTGDIGDGFSQMGSRSMQQDYYDEQTKRWEFVKVTVAAVEGGVVTPLRIEHSKWGNLFSVRQVIEGNDLITRVNDAAQGRVAAIAGPESTLAVDGSGRLFEPGTHLFARMAVAEAFPWKWLGHRIVVRDLHEMPGESSMFEELGVGDWVIPAHPDNPADPYDDGSAMTPGGWAASVIVNAPQGRGAKQFLRFGKLADTISGSLPTPPPPPPPPPGAGDGWGPLHSSGVDITNGSLIATKVSGGDGHVNGRGVLAFRGGKRRFRITVNLAMSVMVGVADDAWQPQTSYLGNGGHAAAVDNDGWFVNPAGVTSAPTAVRLNNGTVVDVEVTATEIAYLIGGAEVLRKPHGLTGSVYPAYNLHRAGDAVTINLSPPDLPAGVLAWNAP